MKYSMLNILHRLKHWLPSYALLIQTAFSVPPTLSTAAWVIIVFYYRHFKDRSVRDLCILLLQTTYFLCIYILCIFYVWDILSTINVYYLQRNVSVTGSFCDHFPFVTCLQTCSSLHRLPFKGTIPMCKKTKSSKMHCVFYIRLLGNEWSRKLTVAG